MQLIRKFNKGIQFSLCTIDIYSKYPSVVSLKGKRGTTIAKAFSKYLHDSGDKPNKTWVDKGSDG